MDAEPVGEDQITLGELQAFVGPNADRYFKKWSAMIEKAGSVDKAAGRASWNWSAFVLGFLWFFYRKMYGYGFGLICITTALWLASTVYGVSAAGTGLIVVPVFVGLFGTGLYLRFTTKQVERVREQSVQSTDATLARLEERGGVSWVALFISLVAVVVVNTSFVYVAEEVQGLAQFDTPDIEQSNVRQPTDAQQLDHSDSVVADEAPGIRLTPSTPTNPGGAPYFEFRYAEPGYSGLLEIYDFGDGTASVSINTASEAGFHTCILEGLYSSVDTDNLVTTPVPDSDCTLGIFLSETEAEVRSMGSLCRQDCGMNGLFVGKYAR